MSFQSLRTAEESRPQMSSQRSVPLVPKIKMAQFLGRVIGTKMDKTAKVLVTRMVLHPKINKVHFFSGC